MSRSSLTLKELFYPSSEVGLAQLLQTNEWVISDHRLAGWLYSYGRKKFGVNSVQTLKTEWLNQWLKNQIFLENWLSLKNRFASRGIETAPIKGIAMLESLYEDSGARAISDIDIYVEAEQHQAVDRLLTENGWAPQADELKWQFNRHKKTYTKNKNGVEIPLEVHFEIMPNCNRNQKAKISVLDMAKLNSAENLVYLSGHLAYQHTFIKLFWLHDIHLLLSKDTHALTQARSVSEEVGLVTSLDIVLHACEKFFKTNLPLAPPHLWWSGLVSESFLVSPRRYPAHYFMVKHLVKGRLKEALWYDFYWFLSKAKGGIGERVQFK
ncbi:MAG: nucleotidyltransferase family protein [Pseudobdellovibrionaceae bacterium]|nr:nucleotidyltransferase family protein [Bdellovibrionales bacterium]USN46772.1 MAG: nucleotidyltransferase family protein [Pseudobdellovibrionaceae bacterium]